MRVLMFGRTGQVAREIRRALPDVTSLSRTEADLRNPDTCAAVIRASRADVIINAAAYTAVDRSESEPELAMAVNAAAPAAMARAAAETGTPFLHISTDYVYEGGGTAPWTEDGATGPLGVYGKSKLAGDESITAAGGPHVILRTSWVFSAQGTNFVKTMLRLGREREILKIVADQTGGPTAATDIAAALVGIARKFGAGSGKAGIYNFAGAPSTNWADFAREIFRQAGLATQVNDIPTVDYPTPAARPGNSRLNCAKIARDYGIDQPDWRSSLTAVLNELKRAG